MKNETWITRFIECFEEETLGQPANNEDISWAFRLRDRAVSPERAAQIIAASYE